MPELSVIAIDWSGAKSPAAQRRGICVAVAGSDGIECSSGRTRDGTIDLVAHLPGPCVVGLDFSFGVPEWFAREHACETIADVWRVAERHGERWIGPPPELPFWRDAGTSPPRERRFRACEEELRRTRLSPSSIFMCVGSAQVGPGSVRGMPHLAYLRASGFAIWPFDPPGDRTVVEIWPTMLEPRAPAAVLARKYETDDCRDAALSAAVMWEHRASFATLYAATDPVTMLEGDVWTPPGF